MATLEEQNIAIIQDYFAKVVELDSLGFMEYFAPDLDYRVFTSAEYCGRFDLEGLKAIQDTFLPTAQGLKVQIYAITAQEDRVSVFSRGTSNSYDNIYNYLFRLRDGKIYAIDEIYVPVSASMPL